ncbi:MAG: PilZ domain-containing protein [Proteobacteria bacterium]|nr:PilZ domain-containing protein [Pseudomonadota bacterium]MBU1639968.1 PilZ domain-containing protein [Pseudomonadota bacterium]
MEDANDDRRSSVRVTGRNLFAYKEISEQMLDAYDKDFQDGISLYSQESLADMQIFVGAQSALGRLRDKDEDLADFLQHLDMKMNILLKKVDDGKTPLDDMKLRDLNLSGAGLAFIAPEKIAIGTLLEFRVVLLPNYLFIYAIGKVTKCETVTHNGDKHFYRVGSEFVLIMDEDREKLIQHNFRQQSLALRNRRKQQDNN